MINKNKLVKYISDLSFKNSSDTYSYLSDYTYLLRYLPYINKFYLSTEEAKREGFSDKFIAAISWDKKTKEYCLFFNVDKMSQYSDQQNAFIILHELKHFIYGHPVKIYKVAKEYHLLLNIAQDIKINTELLMEDSIYNPSQPDYGLSVINNGPFYTAVKQSGSISHSGLSLYYLFPDSPLRKALQGLPRSIYKITAEEILQWLKDYNNDDVESDLSDDMIDDFELTTEEIEEREKSFERQLARIPETSQDPFLNTTSFEKYDTRTISVTETTDTALRLIEQLKRAGKRKKSNPSWAKYNCVLPGILPGHEKTTRPIIACILDTSGSIDVPLAQKFVSYIKRLSKYADIHYVMGDTVVTQQLVKTKNKAFADTIQWKGGGGTDLNPAIKKINEHNGRYKYDAILCFTDGIIPEINKTNITNKFYLVVPKEIVNRKLPNLNKIYL
jgi:hypothetical protein